MRKWTVLTMLLVVSTLFILVAFLYMDTTRLILVGLVFMTGVLFAINMYWIDSTYGSTKLPLVIRCERHGVFFGAPTPNNIRMYQRHREFCDAESECEQ